MGFMWDLYGIYMGFIWDLYEDDTNEFRCCMLSQNLRVIPIHLYLDHHSPQQNDLRVSVEAIPLVRSSSWSCWSSGGKVFGLREIGKRLHSELERSTICNW